MDSGNQINGLPPLPPVPPLCYPVTVATSLERISVIEESIKSLKREFDRFEETTNKKLEDLDSKMDLLLGDRRILLFAVGLGTVFGPSLIDFLKNLVFHR